MDKGRGSVGVTCTLTACRLRPAEFLHKGRGVGVKSGGVFRCQPDIHRLAASARTGISTKMATLCGETLEDRFADHVDEDAGWLLVAATPLTHIVTKPFPRTSTVLSYIKRTKGMVPPARRLPPGVITLAP